MYKQSKPGGVRSAGRSLVTQSTERLDDLAHEVCSVGLAGDVRVELSLGDEQPSGLGWLPNGDLLVVGMTKR